MPDSYSLMIVNKWGQVLERDGTFYRRDRGHEPFSQLFADLDSARRFAETVVQEHPHAACDIFLGDQIVLHYFDDEWRQADEAETRRMFAEMGRRDRWIMAAIVAAGVLLVCGFVLLCLR